MKKAGVYMNVQNGTIWEVEKVEVYKTTEIGEVSIIVSGSVGGEQKINRCLITSDQYKLFKRIGNL